MDTTPTLPNIVLTIPADAIDDISMSFRAHQKIEALTTTTLTAERDAARQSYEAASGQIAQLSDRVRELSQTNIDNAALITKLQGDLNAGTSDRLKIVLAENEKLLKVNAEQSDMLKAVIKKFNDLEFAYDVLSTDSGALADENKRFSARIEELEALVKPPVPPVVVPTDFAPTITKSKLANMAGVTITKDNAPTPKQDEMTKQLLTLAGTMGFNVWRGLLNIEEVRTQAAYPVDDPRSLPAFGRKHGMVFMVDSVDSQAKRFNESRLNKAQYAEYFAGLKKLGCVGVYMNDVDAKDKAEFIEDWVKLTREAMAAAKLDVPLIGSFMATFNRLEYPGFEFYEIQTFGKPSELKTFLARKDVDVFCLDGQRSESVAELKSDTTIQLAANISNFMFYSALDVTTDWRDMPGQVAEIKDFVAKWRLQRAAIVAQPA